MRTSISANSVVMGGLLAVLAGKLLAADPLPLKEERLGAWHYLYPLLSMGNWTRPLEARFRDCDRISFDSRNRLWALGRARIVAVGSNGAWDTYAYSNDRQLVFMPVRMAENVSGEVVLFSSDEGEFPGQ